MRHTVMTGGRHGLLGLDGYAGYAPGPTRRAWTLSTTTLPRPTDEAVEPRRPRRGASVVALVVGLLGVVIAAVLPLAPVVADRTTVTWPEAGEPAASSTTVFLVPYRPAELRVDVPCSAVQAALPAPVRTTLFATAVVPNTGLAYGLLLDAEDGRVRAVLNGRVVATATPPTTDCDVRVDATDALTTVTVGSTVLAELPREDVPEVFAFATDLPPDQARGMTVTARTRTWFESVPSTTKYALIGAHALLALTALALLARTGLRTPAVGRRVRLRRPGLRTLVDVAVVGGLTAWTVIGPQTDDDGFATMTVRNGLVSGDIGNYYRWFNASEAPFALVQHLLTPMAQLSVAPVWLRVPSLLAGLVAWFVVSRGVLGAVLPAVARTPAVRVVAGLAFLAWWLPFNLGVRPEPFLALAVVGVLAILLRGTAPGSRYALATIGAGALAAGAALAITPSGILVFAPLLVLAPRIWRVVSGGGSAGAAQVAGRLALLACLASTALVIMFADQSLHGVRKATQLHTEIGPNLAWYEEFARYAALFGTDQQGTATKRLPVLLTIALLLTVAPLVLRGIRALPDLADAHVVTASAAAGFALLWLTPSKWSHHFGSLAGLGAAFLAVAFVVVVRTARHRVGDRAVFAVGLAGGGLAALAAGVSFSGPNTWFLVSAYGMPWPEGPVRPLGVPLDNPALWALGGAGVVGAAALLRHPRRRVPNHRAAVAAAAAPAVIGTVALAATVAVLGYSFTVAPLRQAAVGSYSLAGQNLDHLTGSSCGVVDKVQVLPDVPGGVLTAASGRDALDDFVTGGGYVLERRPPDALGTGSARYLWGSLAGGELRTGSLVSRWFALPDVAADQEVAVSVAGGTEFPNRVALEFGRAVGAADGSAVTPLGEQVLTDSPVEDTSWRPLAVPAAEVPEGADRVRVRAVDAATDFGGWVAVTGPRLRQVVPLEQFLGGRGPVLVDWPMAWTVPCLDVPVVTDGLAETPRVHIAVPSAYAAMAGVTVDPSQGGSFAGVTGVGTSRVVPSRLAGSPELDWGDLRLIDYPFARDAYGTTTDTVQRWGWQGVP